jgi:hypothetical protein
LATVLALTAVMLLISAIGVAVALVRQSPGDTKAQASLAAVLRAAEDVYRQTGQFTGALPAELARRVSGVTVVDAYTRSTSSTEVSTAVQGDAWFGAVRSTTGRCFAEGTVRGDPVLLRAMLPGNCTGDAARATLVPLVPPPDAAMTPAQSS